MIFYPVCLPEVQLLATSCDAAADAVLQQQRASSTKPRHTRNHRHHHSWNLLARTYSSASSTRQASYSVIALTVSSV